MSRLHPSCMRTYAIILLLVALPPAAFAQKNEIGVLAGGYAPLGSTLDIGPGVAVEGVVSHRLAAIPLLAAYVELPVVVGFHLQGTATFSGTNYSALFVTPGLKLKLAPGFPVSPYLAVGGGYARFHGSSAGISTTDNKGVVDFGGGLDMKVLPFISLRGEVRDFHSGSALLGLGGLGGHNLVGVGGVVLRF